MQNFYRLSDVILILFDSRGYGHVLTKYHAVVDCWYHQEHRTIWLRVINNLEWVEEIIQGRLSAPATLRFLPSPRGHCSSVAVKSEELKHLVLLAYCYALYN